jgi:hypothetical protein
MDMTLEAISVIQNLCFIGWQTDELNCPGGKIPFSQSNKMDGCVFTTAPNGIVQVLK